MKADQFRLALITGATSGIGEALCKLLADKGLTLWITGRNKEKLESLANEIRCDYTVADLSIQEDRKMLVDEISKRTPDLVINNAGFGFYGEALEFPIAVQVSILIVNAQAVLELTLAAAKALYANKDRGVILNVSSVGGFIVNPRFSVYAASKSFVTQVSQSLDIEMRPHGIRVLVSCPGIVATDFSRRASKDSLEKKALPFAMTSDFAAQEIWKQIVARKPLHLFDWKYRIGIFIARYFVPQWLLTKVLMRRLIYQNKIKK